MRKVFFKIPTLILSGARDDWTPAILCEQVFTTHRSLSESLELQIYPDARHSFDNTGGPHYVSGCCAADGGSTTHVIGYDAYAYRQSQIDVARFLNQYLRMVIPTE